MNVPGRFKEHLSFFCGWPRRRLALLQWALEEAAWIVEDDYDSEYRYSGRPVAALQGLVEGDAAPVCGEAPACKWVDAWLCGV